MTLITRQPDDFRVGDRVYDTEHNTIHRITWITDDMCELDDSGASTHKKLLLRVIKPGETIPKGATVRRITASGLAEPFETMYDTTQVGSGGIHVLVSLPEPEEELEDVKQVADAPMPASTGTQLAVDRSPAGERNTCDSPVGTVSNDAILQAAATIYAGTDTFLGAEKITVWAARTARELADLITQKEGIDQWI
jgi:hypothetical protein